VSGSGPPRAWLVGVLAGIATLALLTVRWPWHLAVLVALAAAVVAMGWPRAAHRPAAVALGPANLLARAGFVTGLLVLATGLLVSTTAVPQPWLPPHGLVALAAAVVVLGAWALLAPDGG